MIKKNSSSTIESLRTQLLLETVPDTLSDLVKGPRSKKSRVLVRSVGDLVEYCNYINALSLKYVEFYGYKKAISQLLGASTNRIGEWQRIHYAAFCSVHSHSPRYFLPSYTNLNITNFYYILLYLHRFYSCQSAGSPASWCSTAWACYSTKRRWVVTISRYSSFIIPCEHHSSATVSGLFSCNRRACARCSYDLVLAYH